VGTANFIDPTVMLSVIEGIEKFCIDEGIDDIREIIGSLKL
jgi:dihydroorotate dehydrogenase (NAD+) catalytic subunit